MILQFKKIAVKKIIICGKGEPFLHPDIMKIIELIKKEGFYLNIFTSGIYLNKEILDKLLSLKVDKLTLSIHSADEETYRKVHPKVDAGIFSAIIKHLKYIKEYKKKRNKIYPRIKIVNVIYKTNYKNIDKIINLACKYADELLFKPLIILHKEQNHLELKNKEKLFLINILKKNKCSVNNNISEYLQYLKTENKENNLVISKKHKKKNFIVKCFLPFYQSIVSSNADVIICTYNNRVIGNIKKKDFPLIWFSKEYNRFRKQIDCLNCKGKAVYPYLGRFQNFFK